MYADYIYRKFIMKKQVIVRNANDVESVSCPYGDAVRVVTGGESDIANVHIITVTEGSAHFHSGYSEIYYVLEGSGSMEIEGKEYNISPGSVVVIPEDCVHSLISDTDSPLKFVIFGVPGMSVEDDRFCPKKP